LEKGLIPLEKGLIPFRKMTLLQVVMEEKA
jgi:hypothetical protein